MMDAVSDHWPPPQRWAVIKDARRRQRRRRRHLLVSLTALPLVAALAWGIVSDLQSGHATAPPTGPLVTGVRGVPVTGEPLGTTTLRGNLWVLTCTRPREHGATCRAGYLTEIRAAGGDVVMRTAVADPTELASGAGAIWITHLDRDEVTRIDPHTGRTIAAIHLRFAHPIATNGWRRFVPSGVSFGAGRVWASSGLSFLAEIDPRTTRVTRIVWTDSEATSTSTARGETWIAGDLYGIGVLARGSDRVAYRQIAWDHQPVEVATVAAGAGRIWALGQGSLAGASSSGPDIVTTIDPRTRRILAQWRLPGARSVVFRHGIPYIGVPAGAHVTQPAGPGAPEVVRLPRHADALAAATAHALWATARGTLLRIGLAAP